VLGAGETMTEVTIRVNGTSRTQRIDPRMSLTGRRIRDLPITPAKLLE